MQHPPSPIRKVHHQPHKDEEAQLRVKDVFIKSMGSPIWQSIGVIATLLLFAGPLIFRGPTLIAFLVVFVTFIVGGIAVSILYQVKRRRLATCILILVFLFSILPIPIAFQLTSGNAEETLYTYRGHHSEISKLAWSPDGKRITSYSADGTVQTWDATTGNSAQVRKYYDQTLGASIEEVPSPDAKLVASIVMLPWPHNTFQRFRKGVIRIFDSTTGKDILPQDRRIIGDVNQLVWSPQADSSLIASSEGPYITIWNTRTGKDVHHYSGNDRGCCPVDNYIYALAWSPDGRFIASAGMEGPIQIWEVATGKLYATYRTHCPPSIEGDTVNYIDWQEGVPGPSRMIVECLSYISDTATIKVLSMNVDYNYDYNSNQAVPIFLIKEISSSALCEPDTNIYHAFYSVVWSTSPDSRYIAYACKGTSSIVSIWDIANKRNVFVYRNHTGAVTALDWSPDGQFVASGSQDATVQVWRPLLRSS